MEDDTATTLLIIVIILAAWVCGYGFGRRGLYPYKESFYFYVERDIEFHKGVLTIPHSMRETLIQDLKQKFSPKEILPIYVEKKDE
jgi:hypothetical protein